MENVLAETEQAIAESMRLLLQQAEQRQREQQQAAETTVDVRAWCDWWERQAELLSVMSVAGQSSLITWGGAAQTAAEVLAQQQQPEPAQLSSAG